MGGRAGEHRKEGWQWKTLGLCEAVGRLGVPFKISPGQWDERRETKIKCHYDLSQVEQLLYDSLHLCLAFNKGSQAMYWSSMLTPSCLLCLIHDQNVSSHKHEAPVCHVHACVMALCVAYKGTVHVLPSPACSEYPPHIYSQPTKFSRHHLEEQKSDPVVVLCVAKPSRKKPVCDTSGMIVVFLF